MRRAAAPRPALLTTSKHEEEQLLRADMESVPDWAGSSPLPKLSRRKLGRRTGGENGGDEVFFV